MSNGLTRNDNNWLWILFTTGKAMEFAPADLLPKYALKFLVFSLLAVRVSSAIVLAGGLHQISRSTFFGIRESCTQVSATVPVRHRNSQIETSDWIWPVSLNVV